MKTNFLIIASVCFLSYPVKKRQIDCSKPDEYHAAVENVTQIMIHDIFSPQ
jgi:hypothetical protein